MDRPVHCEVLRRTSGRSCRPQLPPDPPLRLDAVQRLLEQANQSLGRLDGLASVLPNLSLFVYAYIREEAVLSEFRLHVRPQTNHPTRHGSFASTLFFAMRRCDSNRTRQARIASSRKKACRYWNSRRPARRQPGRYESGGPGFYFAFTGAPRLPQGRPSAPGRRAR
ncbi:MAG: hypothetical protein LAQ30_26585 [Acidobacteriia bacterium]|nr:hypothetical protein [Terriglobia bacterium]